MLPRPPKTDLIYEDKKLYACLASFPIAPGHTVVVWKRRVRDLHLLNRKDFEHLMDVVDAVRNALMKTLRVPKVYLIYMDEANQVHWHLVPRRKEKGYTLLAHKPKRLKDFSLAPKIARRLTPLR
ncbi:MAG: HIT family protein [Candidatus Liptonbacteria bacterium]|nr:HIT family protein [Candidatus Liptonbacteria bacterium]